MLYEVTFKKAPNIRLFVNSIPDLQRPKFADAIKGDFRPAKVGEIFGPSWVGSKNHSTIASVHISRLTTSWITEYALVPSTCSGSR
jgi:hypothetical protein